MFFVLVGVLIIVMNLAGVGPVAEWTWTLGGDLWKLCVPFGFAATWWAWADASGYNKRREIEKMDQRKEARRLENLQSLGISTKGRRGKSPR